MEAVMRGLAFPRSNACASDALTLISTTSWVTVMILVALRSLVAADPPSPTARTRHALHGAEARASQADDAEHLDPSERSGELGEAGAPGELEAGGDAVVPPRTGVPRISAVLSAAYAAAGLDRDPGRGWVWRTRLAGLVPWLTVRTARDTSWQDAHSEVGHGASLEVRATWRLDRLLFDARELQVASIEAARRRERAKIAAQVIRAYYAWRRAAEAARRSGDPSRRGGDDRSMTRIDEAIAELDALTDGWLSEELARVRR
jgi:hypothetical protein